MNIAFSALPTDVVRAYQAGHPDANGQPPERAVSEGDRNPCRHCLQMIAAGSEMLILAHRPFPALQPYAELGPIFLCADAKACQAPTPTDALPAILSWPDYIIRGYGPDDRIVYGTGRVVPTGTIRVEAERLLADARIAYLHLRSARNNCYQVRIDPA